MDKRPLLRTQRFRRHATRANTPDLYYGLGIGVARSWIVANPHLAGYNGIVSCFIDRQIAVVIFSTPGPDNPDDINYSQEIFVRIAALLTPDYVPDIPQRSDG